MKVLLKPIWLRLQSVVEAMNFLGNRRIDLIIFDVHLENGGSVFEFLSVTRSNSKTSRTPFVLFSFKPSPKARYLAVLVRTSALLLGASDYVEMDEFDWAKFQECINRIVDLHPVLTDS